MIRVATHDDIDEIVRLGRTFLEYSPHRDSGFDEPGFRVVAGNIIDQGVIFLSEDGFLGAMITPLYFNPSRLTAVELFWWAPKEGTALRQAFEVWAKECGAHQISFTGLCDDRERASRRLFARAGYEAVEICYRKEI